MTQFHHSVKTHFDGIKKPLKHFHYVMKKFEKDPQKLNVDYTNSTSNSVTDGQMDNTESECHQVLYCNQALDGLSV